MDRRSAPWLFALCALATALNVGKPYHVDDAYYLAQARWIAEHPSAPTSGLVFWEGDGPMPFHEAGNHPFLVPALMALVIRVVGESAIALHLLTAAFAALAITLMHVLARRLAPERALVVTSLFALGPAFLAEQNVMLDVPLVASWLAFFVVLEDGSRSEHLVRAGLVASVALMIKLVSVALLALLVLEAVRAIRARMLPPRAAIVALAAPLATLTVWAAWSVAEHGELPLVARLGAGASGPDALLTFLGAALGRAALWPIVVGGILPFALAVGLSRLAARETRAPVVGAIGATLALFVLGRVLVLPLAAHAEIEALAREPAQHTLLRAVFLVVGAALGALVARRARHAGAVDARLSRWIVVGSLAVLVLAPFVAARHALLIAPPSLLLVARAGWLDRHERLAVALTALVGILAAVADLRMAAVYESGAERLAERARELGADDTDAYFVGHWGWQEHATRAGLLPYAPGSTVLDAGDVLVAPDGVHAQRILETDGARLELLEVDLVPAGALDLVRTVVDREGLYCSWLGLPWSLRTEPLERFRVLRVRAER